MPEKTDSDAPLPAIGDWFRDINGESFEVVAIDEDDGTLDVQHFDGTVEEWDLEDWREYPLEAAEPPEDWSGSMDIEREDYGVDLEDPHMSDWNNPLDSLDRWS